VGGGVATPMAQQGDGPERVAFHAQPKSLVLGV
jgi:hypothetical protein